MYSNFRNAGMDRPQSASVHGDDLVVEVEDESRVDPAITKLIQRKLIYSPDIDDHHVEGEVDDVPKQFTRRKVMKTIHVPYTVKVKVPTTTHRIVDSTQKVTVRVKKQVPKEIVEEKEEVYSDIEEVPATRMREVWVKKLVPEEYMKKVRVKKTRKLMVPRTIVEEVEEDQEITVPTTQVVEVPTFRVDELRRTKVVEVEGWQEVELVPRLRDGKVCVEQTREVTRDTTTVERKIGIDHYSPDEPGLANVDTDDDDQEPPSSSFSKVKLDGTEARKGAPGGGGYSGNNPYKSSRPSSQPTSGRGSASPKMLPSLTQSRPSASSNGYLSFV